MSEGKPGATGVRRIWNALFFSWAGLKAAWRHESAFRQECTLALVMIPAGLWLGGNASEKLLLAGSVVLVMITELLNSAVEAVVDRVSTDKHTLSGQAKDMASAAVLLALLMMFGTWGLILGQHLV